MIVVLAFALGQAAAMPPRHAEVTARTRPRAIEQVKGAAIYDCDTSAGVGESSTPQCRRRGARWSCAITYRCVTDIMTR